MQDWNFTLEKEVGANMVVKASYIGNHSDNIQQTINYNDSTPSYIWWASRKEPLPTGEFANVATRPYDQQVYGTINGYGMTGYTNYSGFQVELERRYQQRHRVPDLLGDRKHSGGHRQRVRPSTPSCPALSRRTSTRATASSITRATRSAPKNMIRWNWVADLPFGSGKKFGGNAAGCGR